jgi:hypothetical protein
VRGLDDDPSRKRGRVDGRRKLRLGERQLGERWELGERRKLGKQQLGKR